MKRPAQKAFILAVGVVVTLIAGCNTQIETQIDVRGEEFAKRSTLAENQASARRASFVRIPVCGSRFT